MWIIYRMPLRDSGPMVLAGMAEERKSKAFEAWIRFGGLESFDEYWARCQPQRLKSDAAILSENDRLFAGR